MSPAQRNSPHQFPLTEEHRMLLQIRDTLYEGSWEDFVCDLRARAGGRPHVFETVPDSSAMKAAIENHLTLIEAMRAWEQSHRCVLSADDSACGGPAVEGA